MSGLSSGGRTFSFEPYDYREVAGLVRELELAEPVAVALARRGLGDVEMARTFLAADQRHDPFEFDGMEVAVGAIRGAIEGRQRITVHGDYDVDGVTSTAILVGALRELGADCDWLIPDRSGDGYGVTMATIARLAERGTGLLVTVDCGITSVAEVAEAKKRGIGVVVTDHHQPGDELPDCPIVHPITGAYPCPDLCAAAVAYKLVAALAGEERAERDIDLVGLATVADMVPLRGENRALARRGIAAARQARRPGLAALMAAASVLPERLDETGFSFRLAPRINAAGRLYRADAAVELLLTEDRDRAREIAADLDRANHERRATERDVLADAERRLAALPAEQAGAPGLVVWGEDWHAGVVGICASRMAERHGRPTVLIALDAQGRGKGSGRSVPGFDLLEALRACGQHLARFGGHRTAAGLEVEGESLDAFRAAFASYVAEHLGPEPAVRTDPVDAVVGGEGLGHDVATQLARLGPFGQGNPPIRLLVPAAQLDDVQGMGEGERHSRFTLRSAGMRAAGVAFGSDGKLGPLAERGALDVAVRLELNEWNGAVSPRVVLDATYEPDEPDEPSSWSCPAEEHSERLLAELAQDPTMSGGKLTSCVKNPPLITGGERERVERRPGSGIATVASLASGGAPVLVVCADALWRRALVEHAAPPHRFGGGALAILASRGSLAAGLEAAEAVLDGERPSMPRIGINEGRLVRGGGVALADWHALAAAPTLASRFEHVVVVDPAPSDALASLASRGAGYLHVLAEAADPDLALRAAELHLPTRPTLATVYRALRSGGMQPMASAREALCGTGAAERSPEAGARALRVLREIGVVRVHGDGREASLEPVSSGGGDLGSSPSFRAYSAALEDTQRWLRNPPQTSRPNLQAAA